MKLSNFLEEEEFLPNISCKGKIKHSVNPTYHYKSKSGNGLDLDSIFQTLGPCQSLGSIFQPGTISVFQKLWLFVSTHMRVFAMSRHIVKSLYLVQILT